MSIGRLIQDQALSGFENMAVDSALVESVLSRLSGPVFRFYFWKPPALSLGYHQPLSEVLAGECKQAGIDIVRRPTGGRAVLHDGELTYSVVLPLGTPAPSDWYDLIHHSFHLAFSRQNIPTGYTTRNDDFKSVYSGLTAVPCFISSAKSELTLKGKKLVGSAQRVYGSVLLQHGSILLTDSHLKIADLLACGSEEEREQMRINLNEKSTSIARENYPFSVDQFLSDIPGILAETLGIRFQPDALKPEEQEMVYHFRKKYRSLL